MSSPDDVLARPRGTRGTGRQGSFDEAVADHYRRVWNVAFQMVGDPDDASDIAQEAFARACGSIDRFRHESSLSTWLYRITVNLCMDFARMRTRRAALSLDRLKAEGSLGDLGPVTAGDPAGSHNPWACPLRELEARELRAKLKEAMLSLSDAHRAAVVLRDVEGLSCRETARILGCPEGTVMSRLFYARRVLRDRLEPYLDD